jgi:hypothetical protein
MSDSEQLERDLREYLEKEPNLNRADRLAYLKAIITKHQEMTNLEHLVNYKDLFNIFSDARGHIVKSRMPVFITKKQLDTSEAVHVSVMEAFILYLNRMQLLKKLVKFDYKD